MMGWTQKYLISFAFVFLFILQTYLISLSNSQSIIKTLPGYPGNLPFTLETGYVGIGEDDEVELFYYFVESEGNPVEDPLIFFIPGGPGSSALLTLVNGIGPLWGNMDNPSNLTLSLNPNSWTKMANVIFIDNSVGSGFSYAKTKKAWISSDTTVVIQAKEFLKKFITTHPKLLKNPIYISGVSYTGLVAPIITLGLYEDSEHGDPPRLNIQGYILCAPLTDKFTDFNSRLEYAHRMALISDDIHKQAIENCRGNYVNTDAANLLCADSLERYKECTRRINLEDIYEPVEDDSPDLLPNSPAYIAHAIEIWANDVDVQRALKIRQGTIEKCEMINSTLHYEEGKNDTKFYSYDIFSNIVYQKKLTSKNSRALVFSGDHDMTFPYVGIEQWITSLNIKIEIPWKPFYVDNQVGGYEMTYAHNDFSLTFATIKGAGHLVPVLKPRESWDVVKRWLVSPAYSSKS